MVAGFFRTPESPAIPQPKPGRAQGGLTSLKNSGMLEA